MKGPDYTTKDLFYYSGLILGIIAAYLLLAPLEWHPLLRLLCGLAAGVALGWVVEKAYVSLQGTSEPGPSDQEPPP